MKRVLLTGMSGTGKSTVIEELAARGYIRQILSTEDVDLIFLSGCAPNQVRFYPQFDHIILLTAAAPVITARLTTRTNNPYGKQPAELARVLHLQQTIEPLPRPAADLELDTNIPVDQVVATILRHVQLRPR